MSIALSVCAGASNLSGPFYSASEELCCERRRREVLSICRAIVFNGDGTYEERRFPIPAAYIRDLTQGGPSAIMDMTPGATQPIVDAIAMARGDGRILLAGLKGRRPVEIMSDMLIMKRLSILTGPGSTPDAMARAAEVLNAGGFPTEALRGEVYTLDQLDEALAMLDRNIEGRDAVRINLVHL